MPSTPLRIGHAAAASLLLCAGATTAGARQSTPSAAPQSSTSGQTLTELKSRPEMQQPAPEVRGTRPVTMTLVTSAGRIAAAPASFHGLSVSVHGPVAEVMGPRAFTIDEDAWFAGPDLLVVVPNAKTGARALDKAEYVTVVGTVRPFVRAELERDYDWFGRLPGLDIELESRPLLVAEVVRTSDGQELATSDSNATRLLVTSPGEIAQVPGRFYGRSVSVHAEVEDVKSQRLFTLDEDRLFAGPDLLVVNPFPLFAPEDNEMVTVVGTVRPYVAAEFERDYAWFDAKDFGTDLRDRERRPVLVAHSIIGRGDRQIVRLIPDFTLERSARAMASRTSEGQPQSTQNAARETQKAAGSGQSGATGTSGATGPVTDAAQLVGADAASVAGRVVNLPRVTVQRVEGDRTLWIGPNPDRTVLVFAGSSSMPAGQGLSVGDMVSIEGTVVRPAAGATGVAAKAPFYIVATRVRSAGR